MEKEILSENSQSKNWEEKLVFETQAMESNLSLLLKVNRDLRKEFDQFEEGSQAAEDEMGFLEPKIKTLTEKLEGLEEELNKEEEKIKVIKEREDVENAKILPLIEQKEELLLQLNDVSLAHAEAEENWRKLDLNFSSLNRIRETAFESYNDAKKPIMEEIITPFEIFYGNTIEAEVDSFSAKENGFFIKMGLDQGICSGFTFLLQTGDGWSEIPDFVECTLAERNYSFFKILGKNDSPNDFSFEEGKKLSLIRTAELTSSSDSSDSSEETNFYPNEL